MKITQDVREYAAQKEIDERAALDVGMKGFQHLGVTLPPQLVKSG